MIFKSKNPEKITYEYYRKNKGIKQYFFKKYNYFNLSKPKKSSRLNFLITNIILTILSLLGFFNNPLNDSIGYLILAIFFLILGFTVLFLGFLRSIYPIISFIAIIFLNISIIDTINNTDNKVLLIIFIIILNLTLISIIIYILNKDFISRRTIMMNYFHSNKDFFGIDIDIKDFIPIENYNTLLKVVIDISKEYNADILNKFDQNLFRMCEKNKYILISHKSAYENQSYEVYIATDSKERLENDLTKIITKYINYDYSINSINENVWDYYLNKLYPDDYMFLKENTKIFVNNLENDNFDFSKEYPISFLIQFQNKKDAINSKKYYKKFGYEKAIDFPGGDNKIHFIAVQVTSKLGLQRSLKITKEAYEYGIKYNGIMVEWRIGELIKQKEITNGDK